MTRAGTAAATALALVCFALNSVLCRLALRPGAIDAASFSTLRLASGAALLWLILAVSRRGGAAPSQRGWRSPLLLFLYAVPFSFAYLTLGVGAGALILFGAVQTTMIASGLFRGERPRPAEWLGLGLALGGLVYLVLPGLAAPPLAGSILMAAAGVAWGFYSLRGRGSPDPLGATARNFLFSVPFAALVSAFDWRAAHLSRPGLALAVASGAIASGLGYVVWYAALRGLTATRAATVQLAVPVLAAALGVLVLDEPVTLRLAVAAVLILGGVGLATSSRGSAPPPPSGRPSPPARRSTSAPPRRSP